MLISLSSIIGKTSTKEYLAAILSEKFNVLKTREHQNSEVGISECILNELNDVVYYYYNHHIEKGGPVGSHLDQETRLHCFLYAELLKLIQQTCIKNNQNGLSVLKYDVNIAAGDPQYIDYNMTVALKQACTVLKNNCNVKMFFIIDNLDEYSKNIQVKAVDIADHISTWDNIFPLITLRPETYHRTQTHLKHPRQFAINPVSLNNILYKRLFME